MRASRGYVDLQVWTKAMDLAAMVYAASSQMPKSELYGMRSQDTVRGPLALADEVSRILTRLKQRLEETGAV